MDIFKIEIKEIIIILSLILFSAWTIRLSHKIFDKKTKRYVLAIGGLLVFWIMARLVRMYNGAYFVWYLYYVSMIFIPTIYYLLSRYLTGRYNKKLSYFVIAVSFVLLILVLTNNFHELVFEFKDDDYKNVTGYYVIFAWIIFLAINATINLIVQKKTKEKKINILIPFIPLIIGIIFTFLYINGLRVLSDLDMSVILGTIFMISLETLFMMNLIPNNISYEEVFCHSYLPICVLSQDGKMIYETNNIIEFPEKIIKDIRDGSIKNKYVNDTRPSVTYDVERLDKGYAIIENDSSNIDAAKEHLNRQNKKLKGQERLLKKQRRIKEKLYEIKINNEIFETLSRQIEGKRLRIEELIDGMDKPDIAGLNEIKLLIAYCKRMSNLIVSNYNDEVYDTNNLLTIFNELLTDSVVFGIKGYINAVNNLSYESIRITSLYDMIFSIFYNTKDTEVLINMKRDVFELSFDKTLGDLKELLTDGIYDDIYEINKKDTDDGTKITIRMK